MSTVTKEVIKAWCFRSSNGHTLYQTLQFADAFISCDCPGWTKRVTANGGRDCKHVRMVQMGVADAQAVTFSEYGKGRAAFPAEVVEVKQAKVKQSTRPAVATPVRAFNFDE